MMQILENHSVSHQGNEFPEFFILPFADEKSKSGFFMGRLGEKTQITQKLIDMRVYAQEEGRDPIHTLKDRAC